MRENHYFVVPVNIIYTRSRLRAPRASWAARHTYQQSLIGITLFKYSAHHSDVLSLILN